MQKAITEKEEKNIYLLNILRETQKKYGYLPETKIRELSKKTNIPVVKLYDMASFYSMFSFDKKGKKVIKLCNSPSCYLNDSLNILSEIKKILGIDVNETTKDWMFTLELTSCIGCCNEAPAMMINDELIGNVTKEKLRKLLK